jgi:G:T-mismatch repair DNA endonuclease (very short patch repair protein)
MNHMDNDAWARLYRTLASMGLPQPAVPCRLELTGKKKSTVMLPLGWPTIKLGIAFDHSDAKVFTENDWTVIMLTAQTANQLPAALRFLDDIAFNFTLRKSEADATMTVSSHERLLLEGILRTGMPEPDRNYTLRREDGTTLTIPDFTWADIKLAVFVDGVFWHHGGKALHSAVKDAAAAGGANRRAALKDRAATSGEKDARNRRAMTANGWTCISVSDKEIEKGPEEIAKVVAEIKQTYATLQARST